MKYTFYISNQGVNIYQDKRQAPKLIQSYSWSDFNGIDTFLANLPGRSPVSIILDLVEEDITIEAFPKLYLWERNAVKNRHEEQHRADGAEFVHTQWTGQSQTTEEGRQEEFILTSSITSPAHVVNFMGMVEEAEIMVVGLYSASFLMAEYFKNELSRVFDLSKQEMNSPFFLVSRQSERSYRQTFFNQSGIRISRLIEIDKEPDDYEGFKAALVHETKLAKNYIYNQNIIEPEVEISYIFMDGDSKRLEGLQQLSEDEHLYQTQYADSNHAEAFFKTLIFTPETGNANEINPQLTELYAARDLAGYIFRRSPESFYSTPYSLRIKNLLMGYRGLVGVNSIIFLGLLIFITISGIDWTITQDKIERLESNIVSHELEKNRLQKEVALQVDAEEIKASVEFSEAILKLKTDKTVGFNIKPISDIVAQHEHIQVMKLNLKKMGQFDSRVYEIDFHGWVYPFEDYFREPVMWVDAFKEQLETIENVHQVTLVQEPLNRDLKQALLIGVDDKVKSVDALPFQIKLRVSHE
ncbi:MAG: hypothetical protein U9R28_00105 [Pseudomonadota bacterium]|nr:hypothetical protein [Pseudomonadota bacterium]